MKKSIFKYSSYTLFLVGASALALWYILKDVDLGASFELIKNANPIFIATSVFSVGSFYILESIIFYLLLKHLHKEYTLKQALPLIMIGYLFNAVTPFASGGQVIQLFILTKHGVPTRHAMAALLMKFIFSQITMTLLTIGLGIPALLRYSSYTGVDNTDVILLFSVVGIGMNTLVLVSLFVVSYSTTIQRFIANIVYAIGEKFKLIKNRKKKVKAFKKRSKEFKQAISNIWKHKKLMWTVLALCVAKALLDASLTYQATLAVDSTLASVSFIDLISMTQVIETANTFMPTPGAAGTTEFSYQSILNSLIVNTGRGIKLADELSVAIMLLWRTISFYLLTITSLGFFTVWTLKHKKKK